jgi:uncharacterized SAM-binding protein YcdF (DUF218 family)
MQRIFSPGCLAGWSRWLLLGLVVLIMFYFLAPAVLTASACWLVRTDPLTQADVVIALGGDARALREREAAALYRRGLARKVVVSGVPYVWGMHTSDTRKQYVVSLGVPEHDVLALRDVWNTRQEAIALAHLMHQHRWKSAIIVTAPFHSRRALYTFQRFASDLAFYSAPVPARPPEWQPERWWTRRGDAGHTVREFLAWGNTLVRGFR